MRTFQMVTSYTAWKQQDSRLPAVSLMGSVPPTPRFWGQFPPPAALSIHTPPNQCFSVFSRHCFFVFPLSFSFYSTSLTAVAPQHQGEFIPSHPLPSSCQKNTEVLHVPLLVASGWCFCSAGGAVGILASLETSDQPGKKRGSFNCRPQGAVGTGVTGQAQQASFQLAWASWVAVFAVVSSRGEAIACIDTKPALWAPDIFGNSQSPVQNWACLAAICVGRDASGVATLGSPYKTCLFAARCFDTKMVLLLWQEMKSRCDTGWTGSEVVFAVAKLT